MSSRPLLRPAVRRRVLRIAAAVVLMAGAVALLDWMRARSGEEARFSATNQADAPIASEADVFRLQPGDLAAAMTDAPRAGARRRTMARFQSLRAYAGAPPRIPHALTADEFMVMTCNSCHESGGYSKRFGAYTPVTPHPEYRNCLQCHAADEGSVEVRVPAVGSAFRVNGGTPAPLAALDWKTAKWPRIDQRAMPGSPPVIPHDFQLRGNCLACHAGPSAVAEIRTTHPERANCRQCHVPAKPYEVDGEFTRSRRDAVANGGAR
jgi:nitrate reductase (cytochrome), electron transfer subunit